MLDRLTKIQLSIFAVITVLTVTEISLFYLHLPAKLGLGSYHITADFVTGGGLYQNANVAYRGVTVGRVESLQLTGNGIDASMRLNSDVKIPSNVTATVKSVSAIGEQYVDLVPPGKPSKDVLRNDSRIGQDRTAVGQDIADLLRDADNL